MKQLLLTLVQRSLPNDAVGTADLLMFVGNGLVVIINVLWKKASAFPN